MGKVGKMGRCIRCNHNTQSYIGVWVNGLVLCKHCSKAK